MKGLIDSLQRSFDLVELVWSWNNGLGLLLPRMLSTKHRELDQEGSSSSILDAEVDNTKMVV